MSNDRRRIGAVVVALVVLLVATVGLVFGLLLAPAGPPRGPTEPSRVVAVAPPATPRRVRVPRPPPRPVPEVTAPKPAEPPPEPADEAPDVGRGPVDKRGGDATDGAALKELLTQQMDAVARAVQPCADAWAAQEPELDGRIVLRFGLDADGLQDVWIEDHDDVPGVVLDCFADAVWLGDWSGITPDPLEVSWPFHVTD